MPSAPSHQRADSKNRGLQGQLGQKKPSGAGIGSHSGNPDAPLPVMSPDNKRKKQEDWNYLKNTLRSNNMMNGNDKEAEQLD